MCLEDISMSNMPVIASNILPVEVTHVRELVARYLVRQSLVPLFPVHGHCVLLSMCFCHILALVEVAEGL